VSATDPSGNTSSLQAYTIDIVPKTGLEYIDQSNGVRIYPNPSTKDVYIHSPEQIISVKVYDLNGRLIQQNTSSEKIQIENPGTFIMEIETAKMTFRRKILVD
jgi:hypothetical protein